VPVERCGVEEIDSDIKRAAYRSSGLVFRHVGIKPTERRATHS
jgi:hypothetical protein